MKKLKFFLTKRRLVRYICAGGPQEAGLDWQDKNEAASKV